MMIRLQKILANAGICSRRAAERLIARGDVAVDGAVVTQAGLKVDPELNRVSVRGEPVRLSNPLVYIMLNKPRGVVSTACDPQGRKTVLDLVSEVPGRIYPVGRLDKESEGLILLTNDGALANRLIHPRHKVAKVYKVTVGGRPSAAVLQELRKGVEVDGYRFKPCVVRTVRKGRSSTMFEIVLREGKKRQIRRMFAWAGYKVQRLVRIKMGPLSLGNLPPGRWRYLGKGEVKKLTKSAGLDAERVPEIRPD